VVVHCGLHYYLSKRHKKNRTEVLKPEGWTAPELSQFIDK